jgi:uncharacterized damage-inducible protein DinB
VDRLRIRRLYEHNAWANRLVLARAAEVGSKDYFADAVAGLSFGSLHRTLLHELDGEWSWFLRMRGAPTSEWENDLDLSDLDEMRRFWVAEEAAQFVFIDSLSEVDLESELVYTMPNGVEERLPLWQALFHVLTHSIQFRSEAAVRLTQLGVSPGDLDFNNFMDTLAAPGG